MPTTSIVRPRPAAAADGELEKIFLELSLLPEGDVRRDRLRAELARRHLRLVDSLAAHYRGRGEPLEDIVGAGRVGLVKAIDRFDPARGTSFASYASCMIVGEIKRHFRDTTWSVHVPRRLQELRARIRRAASELAEAGVAEPTHRRLAFHLGMDEAEIREARVAANAYSSRTGLRRERRRRPRFRGHARGAGRRPGERRRPAGPPGVAQAAAGTRPEGHPAALLRQQDPARDR